MDNKQRLLNMFGLSMRAGKLKWGFDAVSSAIKSGEAEGLFVCVDISDKTFSNLAFEAERKGIGAVRINVPHEELSFAIGKRAGVFAVCDKGFSAKLTELAGQLNNEE